MARRVEDLPELVTPKEAAEVLNLSRYQLQTLVRERRIGHVPVGSRVMIPRASVREFIANNTVPPCRVETPGPASASSKSAASSTSPGPIAGAVGSAARARLIASELKSRSPTSSANEPATLAPVTR